MNSIIVCGCFFGLLAVTHSDVASADSMSSTSSKSRLKPAGSNSSREITNVAPNKTRASVTTAKIVVLGDMPYIESDFVALEKAIKPRLHAENSNIDFVFHYGDVKKGNEPCSQRIIDERVRIVLGILPGKTMMIPGDNDWTDCDRDSTFDQSQVASMKKIYGSRYFYGKDWKGKLNHQIRGVSELMSHDYVVGYLRRNNASPKIAGFAYFDKNTPDFWVKGPNYVFAGLHFVGTNNGWGQILKDDPKRAFERVLAREKLLLERLEHSFRKAKESNTGSVIIGIHADMFHARALRQEKNGACSIKYALSEKNNQAECSGYLLFKNKLRELSRSFKGAVLLVHGDTIEYCLDQPWKDIRNFWRVNGPGDYQDPLEAAAIAIDLSNSSQPFVVTGHTSGKAYPKECIYPVPN